MTTENDRIHPPPLSRRKKIGFSLICLLLVGGGIESLSWFYLTYISTSGPFCRQRVDNPYDPAVGWVNQPNTIVYTGKSFGPQRYGMLVDSKGRCITPPPVTNPRLTLVVTGGSTVFGYGSSSNNTTLPAFLKRIATEELGLPVEVVNLAVRGYASYQEMVSLHRYFQTENADLVLAISGRNECLALAQGEELPLPAPDPWKEVVPLVRGVESGRIAIVSIGRRLRHLSYTADMIGRIAEAIRVRLPQIPQHVAEDREAIAVPPVEDLDRAARLSIIHYACMNMICSIRGARFAMILQPMLCLKDGVSAREREILRRYWGENIDRSFQQERALRNAFYNCIRCNPKPFRFLDLSSSLREVTETYYVDYCHYNDHGAEVLARDVFEAIRLLLSEILQEKARCDDQK